MEVKAVLRIAYSNQKGRQGGGGKLADFYLFIYMGPCYFWCVTDCYIIIYILDISHILQLSM